MTEFRFADRRKGATFSDDREYRYKLWREWEANTRSILWLMLNPSTADEETLDPTLRRCRNYSRTWGYGRMWIGNLFALRSTDPENLYDHDDPVGPRNNHHLRDMAEKSDTIIVAWGAHGDLNDRHRDVLDLLEDQDTLYCLGWTKEGHPVHPLYQPKDVELKQFWRDRT